MNMNNPENTKSVLRDLYALMDSKAKINALLKAKSKDEVLRIIE